ncbi:acyltransferase [Geofilum sp. OHC36d9]|uniref:acyltransferase n=1 Tax=Geofilum sp. OHC36d9 TaxID=3458413 RepID=UPI004034D428
MDILSKIISYFKEETFRFDNAIPKSYLFRFIFSKIVSLIYGMIRFRTLKRIFIHPSSIIKCSSKIKVGYNFSVARNCYIDALSHNGFVCGNNVSLGYGTCVIISGSLKKIGKGIVIGNRVGMGTHGYYGGGVGGLYIGNDTIIGNYVSFHPENHNYKELNVPIRSQGVTGLGIHIGDNCWIGAKATFLDGSVVGDGSIVAAGAVVIGKFPSNSIIGGVPARVLKSIK